MLTKFGYGADNLEVLAEYVTVMIINNKGLEQVNRELGELIGDDYDSTFATALFEELKGGGEPVGDVENERSMQEMAASTAIPISDIRQPTVKAESDANTRQPIPVEKKVFPSANARLFSSAIGGVLRDAANNSAAAEEMRQYLEGEEERNVNMEDIPTQPAADVRRSRDYPSRSGNGPQGRSYHPSSKAKRAPVASRIGDRLSPYVRPANGNGPMHRLGGGQGWAPGNGPALAMMNGGFPPMVPEMSMLLGMGIPPGMAIPPGMRPPGRMMPMEPPFPVQLGPLPMDRQLYDQSFRRNNILNGDPQNEIPEHLRKSPGDRTGGKKVRCQFWPQCAKGNNCQYFHPTRMCTAYPNCPNTGKTCNFIHPDGNPNEAHQAKESREDSNRVDNGHNPIASQSHWQTTQQMPFHHNLLASSVPGSKIPCKFGSACAKPGCTFFHQKHVGGNAPPCKFYPNCTNVSCPFMHPGGNSSKFSSYGEPLAASTPEDVEMEDTSAKPTVQELLDRPLSDRPKASMRPSNPFKKVSIPCREGAACARPDCHFTHPWDIPTSSNVPCRFGAACTKPGCSFQHPRHQNRSATFNKPVSEHVSERNFSLSEVDEQILPGGGSGVESDVKMETKTEAV